MGKAENTGFAIPDSQIAVLQGVFEVHWLHPGQKARLGAPFAFTVRTAFANSDGPDTGATVGRLIGSRDAGAAKLYVKAKPGPMSDAEFRRMIDRLDAEIAGLRPHSRMQLILQRDKTVMRLLRITGWTAKKALGLTVSDAVRLVSTPKGTRDFPGAVAGLLLTYLNDLRRHLAGGDSGNALFIGWHSGGIGEKDWALRVARIKSSDIRP